MRISVLITNVYSGIDHIAAAIRNLAEQTVQDFELVLVDMFCRENRTGVLELGKSLSPSASLIHVPAMAATNAGRRFHWELYNNALLLSSCEWFYQFGVFRRLHPEALAVIAGLAENGIACVTPQNQPAHLEPDWMSVDTHPWPHLSNSGFFSFPREAMIHQLNGHNECLLLHHWVDVDLTERSKHLPKPECRVMPTALVRHPKPSYAAMKILRPVCSDGQFGVTDCPAWRLDHITPEGWIHAGPYRCEMCNTLAFPLADKWLGSIQGPRAPIGLHGIGRNLALVDVALAGLPLDQKVPLIAASHENPKFLVDPKRVM